MHRLAVRAALLTAMLVLVLEACTTAASVTPPPQAPTASPTPASVATLPTGPATSSPTASPTALPPASASPSATLSGTWNGTWQDVTPDQAGGTFVLTWTQSGTALSGGIVVKGTPCLSIAIVTGTVSGSSINFGAVSGKNTVVYNGTLSGTTMKGSYTAPSACGDAKGTWGATKK